MQMNHIPYFWTALGKAPSKASVHNSTAKRQCFSKLRSRRKAVQFPLVGNRSRVAVLCRKTFSKRRPTSQRNIMIFKSMICWMILGNVACVKEKVLIYPSSETS